MLWGSTWLHTCLYLRITVRSDTFTYRSVCILNYHSPRKHYLPEKHIFELFSDYRFTISISSNNFENCPIPIAFVWVVWHYPVGTPVLVELFFITVTRFEFFRINWVMFPWQMVFFQQYCLQMGAVLEYKLEAYCSTNERRIAGFSFLQSLEARKVRRYRWGAYCVANGNIAEICRDPYRSVIVSK